MLTFNKFFLALAFLGGSAAAQAADGALELTPLPPGKTSERMDRTESELRHGTSNVWSQGLSQQNADHPHASQPYYSVGYQNLSGTHNGMPVARESLSGYYDVGLVQVGSTNLFRAGTIGPGDSVQASTSLTSSPQDWLPTQYRL
ncbi:hypothetical protein [Pseudomonas syringae]|uniref:hypothetical protein n=1 Tax=Pseudomonas syringae TaxID=317 RepID=UPI000816ADB2|nr:hypothetical protein [Pseudomonas syringae]